MPYKIVEVSSYLGGVLTVEKTLERTRILRIVKAMEDFSKMALESTDPDPAYRRAYADIAQYVRQQAYTALVS
jgi:hypothetical protein